MTTTADYRQCTRAFMTAARTDDPTNAAQLLRGILADRDATWEAINTLGQLLDLAIADLAHATDCTVAQVWQQLATRHACHDPHHP